MAFSPKSIAQRERVWSTATVLVRLALVAGFLSAVADRFGWWGAPHTGTVAWGNFAAYTAYTQTLTPYLTGALLDAAAWVATVAELVLGLMLLAGLLLRWTAWAASAVLLVFGLSMALFLGWEAPLSASVFAAAAAALLLALSPVSSFAFSFDRLFDRTRNDRLEPQR